MSIVSGNVENIVAVVQPLSHVQLFATPWTLAFQAPLFSTVSWSSLRFMSTESVMLSNHLFLCCPLLLLPSVFPSIRVLPISWHFSSGGFPGGSDGKESAYNVGDPGSIPGLGRSPGGEQGNPLQYSSLEKPTDRGAWRATDHGVPKSETQLSN